MPSTTVRCPNCRKKQEEPYPQRCGCGQSLLAAIAAYGRAAEARRPDVAAVTRYDAGRSLAASGSHGPDRAIESGDNEW